jgi:hypothetical protein
VTGLAPDVAGRVAGFRAWKIVGHRLLSPFIPCRWDGPVLHAACFDANRRLQLGRGWLAEPHDAPHPDCQCGIYAYHRQGAQAYYGEFEWTEGVVSCWGRLEVHAAGLRAEHARIEALARPPADQPARARAVEAIARALGVATVEREELGTVAAASGGPLPRHLRPVM